MHKAQIPAVTTADAPALLHALHHFDHIVARFLGVAK
jgi:hypothetical protein